MIMDKKHTFDQFCEQKHSKPGNNGVKSSYFSKWFFWWITSLLKKGYGETLTTGGIDELSKNLKCEITTARMAETWKQELLTGRDTSSSLSRVIMKLFGQTFAGAAIIQTFSVLLGLWSPFILHVIIQHTRNKDDEEYYLWKGIFYSCVMLLISVISTTCNENVIKFGLLMGMQLKISLTALIYKKSLQLSNAARKRWNTGKILNLMSVDTQAVLELCNSLLKMWKDILQVVIPIFLLLDVVGIASLTGILVLIIAISVNVIASFRSKIIQKEYMKHMDERVNLISEFLDAIKVIKLYAWENSFTRKIEDKREQELKYARNVHLTHSINRINFALSSYFATFAVFTTYVLMNEANHLTPELVFLTLSLLHIIRMPLLGIPFTCSRLIQAFVSLNRINNFLVCPERRNEIHNWHNWKDERNDVVKIVNGSFSWIEGEKAIINNVNLTVKRGSLIGIVGNVGSGKSSLLASIIGESFKVNGELEVLDDIAYVSQESWIQNATLQDNIIFYNELINRKLNNVVEACALKADIGAFKAGMLTEIGEKGINLSGGQKQRVCLARAVYSDANLYLFDDPLSAVDCHVGENIMEKVIGNNGILSAKTRILVTQSLSHLRRCDYIYTMENGRISERTTYQQLKLEYFSDFLTNYQRKKEKVCDKSSTVKKQSIINGRNISLEDDKSVKCRNDASDISREKGKLVQDESVSEGFTKLSVYIRYAKQAGIFSSLFSVFGFCAYHGLEVASTLWLSAWSKDPVDENLHLYRIKIYGIIGIGLISCSAVAFVFVVICTNKTSRTSHCNLLRRIVGAPMSFFDTTPLGRILNRFSTDINIMDTTFVHSLQHTLFIFWKLFASYLIICINVPMFFLAIAFIAVFYLFCVTIYTRTSRQLMRLESVTRSPIYSHFAETITGSAILRTYRKEKVFFEKILRLIDTNAKCYYHYMIAERWIAVNLQIIGGFIVFVTCLFAFIQRSLDPSTVGLIITYSMVTVHTISSTVMAISSLEVNAISIDRIFEYSGVEQETKTMKADAHLDKSWPYCGRITFTNYCSRYRKEVSMALNNINVDIKEKEKIAIVGRTGAGKSSFVHSLFRLMEPTSGNVTIDGVDISTVGLHELRSKLTIIPQDPVLFTGTLRMNFDPLNVYEDSEIWKAIEHGHLQGFLESLENGLQHPIEDGGNNLSVGQKQLICLVRALLRKTKILILDEATACIDVKTDELIGNTVRKEFKDCTVITVAHRISTVLDSDRVMVMENGEIVELDSPSNLLSQPESAFGNMVKNSEFL